MSLKTILKKNVIVGTLAKLSGILPKEFKTRGLMVFALLFINSILELAGLSALVPILISVLQENAFEQSWLKAMYEFSGLASTNMFIIALCGVVFVFYLVKNGCSILIIRYQARFSYDLYTYVSTRLQRYIYQMGFLYFKGHNHNEISRDISSIPMLFTDNLLLGLIAFLTEVIVLIMIVVIITIFDYRSMLMLVFVIVPVFSIFYKLVKNKITGFALDLNDIEVERGKNLYQSIFGFVDVMINNNKEWFFNEYHKNVSRMSKLKTSQFVYNMLPPKVIETTMILAILMIIGYGLLFLPSRDDLVLLLGVFALAAYRILPSINRMMMSLMKVKSYQFTAEVVECVKLYEKHEENNEELTFNDKIEVKDLFFQYSGKDENVLQNISFTVKKGQTIGFVGRSGSGKTTLINIMLGFLQASKGNVEIDGTVLSEDYLVSWRKLIGYVQQEVFLVDGTLADNIALGYGEIDEERVLEVAKRASLTGLIDDLEGGIHSQVGERGSRISGGQRQRVGIARALYSGAKVLFFDEATSALDSETETEITEAINNLSQGDLTMFIIAHRLSTLKYCDRIIELKDGKMEVSDKQPELD
ncbi:MAG: ABC transporter ATP-binding protein/permease [Flavobacteriales bacterium]|nr:ABC transporter ATP-binding protein/permease [Flavobacteriales bacterium]